MAWIGVGLRQRPAAAWKDMSGQRRLTLGVTMGGHRTERRLNGETLRPESPTPSWYQARSAGTCRVGFRRGSGKATMKEPMIALAAVLLASPVHAADSIEAVGAERCGGKVNTYEVEFLAPESTQVEAGKGGATDPHRETASLALDGQPCRNAKCSFHANKGHTYRLVAQSTVADHDELCISVTRP